MASLQKGANQIDQQHLTTQYTIHNQYPKPIQKRIQDPSSLIHTTASNQRLPKTPPKMNISTTPNCIQSFFSQNASKFRPSTSLIITSAPPNNNNPNSSLSSNSKPNKTDHALTKFHHSISQQCKSISFYMGMQHNFKTVQYGNETLVSSFPTIENHKDVHEFMRRTMGGSTAGTSSMGTPSENPIVGVGSGASIDLAKTCYLNNKTPSQSTNTSSHIPNQPLVFIPSTLGSILASTSKQSLLLDINEEALITNNDNNLHHDTTTSTSTYNSTSLQPSDYEHNIHILIDPNTMAIPTWYKRTLQEQRFSQRRDVATITDASLSSLVIALDAYLSSSSSSSSSSSGTSKMSEKERHNLEQCIKYSILTLQQIVSIHDDDHDHTSHDSSSNSSSSKTGDGNDLTKAPSIEMKQNAIQAVLHAGQLLSFGNEHDIEHSSSSLQPRNISLALSSALLPKYFPHGNWMTFTATLLPAILSCLRESTSNNTSTTTSSTLSSDQQQHVHLKDPKIESSMDWLQNEFLPNHSHTHEWIPSLSSLAEGAPNVNELISKVHHNSAFLNTIDCNSDYLEKVLFLSLDR